MGWRSKVASQASGTPAAPPAAAGGIADFLRGKAFAGDTDPGELQTWRKLLQSFRPGPLPILEIGSFEGRSAVSFLHLRPEATITCIDAWAGESGAAAERRFDANVGELGNRVTKIRDWSFQALKALADAGQLFDFIHVDGDHSPGGVLTDSVLAWHLLRPGGILLWSRYRDPGLPVEERPDDAVNHFITACRAELDVLLVDGRLAIRRVKGGDVATGLSFSPEEPARTDDRLRAPAPAEGLGPVAMVSAFPPIFLTGMSGNRHGWFGPSFGDAHGDVGAGFIVYPTWSIERAHIAAKIHAAAWLHRKRFPRHALRFICNTRREAELLAEAGEPATFLNKNIIVSENVFRPLAGVPVEFDAIYNARFVPAKRHDLAANLDRVAYVTYAEGPPEEQERQRVLLSETMARQPRHVLVNTLQYGLPVRLSPAETNAALARAAVGLCLSPVEGSNYASMEYMLAGLPVVSTPSLGGRDVFFDEEYCVICEPAAEAVREAVEALKKRNLPRGHIRARTLAKIEPERKRFLSLVNELLSELGSRNGFVARWPDTNGVIPWDSFGNHVRRFEAACVRLCGQGTGILALAAETGLAPNRVADLLREVQLTPAELLPIVRAIAARPGGSLLVFGCGNDSVFWEEVNRSGMTAFIEDNRRWAIAAHARLARASVHLVRYDTRLSQWQALLDGPDENLALKLPTAVAGRLWDVILVDAPPGYDDHQPGRMKSIRAAARLVAPGGCVFVHDCERIVEHRYAIRFLGSHRLFVQAKGRSRLNGYAF
jgi:glycosyltransferase involved in cell wall biosynthesis/predicted O-methyltransferase YrrM